eukprot:1733405-Prymnesium_polylepis.1
MPVRVVVLARATRRVVVRKRALDEDVVWRGEVDLGEDELLELLLRRLRQYPSIHARDVGVRGHPQLPDDVRKVVQ